MSAIRSMILFVLLGHALASPAGADAEASPPGPPRSSLLLGVGNATGWLGGQAEVFFSEGRFSTFLGVGYTPRVEDYSKTGLTGALGARAFTRGRVHRGFLELSVAQLAVPAVGPDGIDGDGLYGPGVQVGYQLIRPSGFSLIVSAGAGTTFEALPGGSRVQGMFTLAIGKTWRRR